MKKYEFESSLSKEEIYQIIEKRSKKFGIQNFGESPAFGDVLHKTNPQKDSFYLYCYSFIKGGCGFYGKISESDGKTVIIGEYRLPWFYLLFAVCWAIPALIMSDFPQSLVVAAIGIFATAALYGVMSIFSMIFGKKAKAGVFKFIENNLI